MIQDTVKDKFDALRGLGTEDVLAALGLERRRSAIDVMLPAAGIFFAGLIVGSGVALLVAPKSGRETRRQLKGKATELSHRLASSADTLAENVRDEVFGGDEPKNGGMARAQRTPANTNPQTGPQK
jgi:hypothetical protein